MYFELLIFFSTKVIAKKLPGGQLVEFLDILQEGLLDPQSHSSSGACVVLNGLLKARGSEVSKQVIYVWNFVNLVQKQYSS